MWIVVFLGLAAAAKASLIQYLPQLDELRATAENVSRVGHVDVIQEVPPDFDPYHKEIAVCHLAHLMPGSFVTSEGERTLITITIGTWEGRDLQNMRYHEVGKIEPISFLTSNVSLKGPPPLL